MHLRVRDAGDRPLHRDLLVAVVLVPDGELALRALLALHGALAERDRRGDVDVLAGDVDAQPMSPLIPAVGVPKPFLFTSTLKSPVIFQLPTSAISASANGCTVRFSSVSMTSLIEPCLAWLTAVLIVFFSAPCGLAPTSIVPCVPSHQAKRR